MNEATLDPSENEKQSPDSEPPKPAAAPVRAPAHWPLKQNNPQWQIVSQRSPLKTALYMVGLLMILFSVTMLPPMGVAWWYDGHTMWRCRSRKRWG
jgi:trk system potassium uptake protein TrkH